MIKWFPEYPGIKMPTSMKIKIDLAVLNREFVKVPEWSENDILWEVFHGLYREHEKDCVYMQLRGGKFFFLSHETYNSVEFDSSQMQGYGDLNPSSNSSISDLTRLIITWPS